MKVVIFGATGATGKVLVEQAISKGNTVTAFVRNPDRLPIKHERLIPYTGNLLSYDSVAGAIKNQDAVLCTLGTRSLKKSTVLSSGIKNILTAMDEKDVKRFIYMSAHGAGDSYDKAPFFTKLAIRYVLKNVFEDKALQETLIKQTTLNWTIVHATTLLKSEKVSTYKDGENLFVHAFSFISHANVSDFMLKQLEDSKYIQKTVLISQ